jgi:hypothetical protein
LRRREQRVPREHEPVPEREAAVDESLPDGRAPRDVREREVGEDRVRDALDAALRGDGAPRVVRVVEVRGTVEVAAQESFSGEGERQESEEDARLPRNP